VSQGKLNTHVKIPQNWSNGTGTICHYTKIREDWGTALQFQQWKAPLSFFFVPLSIAIQNHMSGLAHPTLDDLVVLIASTATTHSSTAPCIAPAAWAACTSATTVISRTCV
jgi:hypothetical protein